MTDDGGQAFPKGDSFANGGMSLRDWFAGQALAGILMATCDGDQRGSAERSYELADAMLVARKPAPGKAKE